MFKNAYFYAIAAVLYFVGTFLPWVTVLGFSANGMSVADGKLMIGLSIVTAFAFFLDFEHKLAARILAGLVAIAALIVGIYQIVDIMSYSASPDDTNVFSDIRPSTGIGLWLIVIGACVALVGSVRAHIRSDDEAVETGAVNEDNYFNTI